MLNAARHGYTPYMFGRSSVRSLREHREIAITQIAALFSPPAALEALREERGIYQDNTTIKRKKKKMKKSILFLHRHKSFIN